MSTHSPSASASSRLFTGAAGDLRHAARLLWKGKATTAITLLTLALCIGATTAISSSVYSLMLKPLPFDEPEQIVELYTSAVKAGLPQMPANVPMYLDYSANASSYEAVGLWSFFYGLVGSEDATTRLPGARMTAEMFQILRVQPVIGTFFTKEQNQPGADRVLVLTHSHWLAAYDGSPEVLGREITIDDQTYQVIGVAPRVFDAFDARVKFVMPLSWPPAAENPAARYGVGIQLFGRLKPGVFAAQADAEAKTIEQRYVDASPAQLQQFVERSGMTMNVGGVQEQRVEPVRSTLLLLQVGVAFVLLIGCVNVANLLLTTSNARQSELAVRSALGASRMTIARQLMLESLLLTSIGAVLGVGLAWAALRVTNTYLSSLLPQALPAVLDLRVLGFAVIVTIVVGVLIGLVPVWHVLRTNLVAIMQQGTRGSSSGRGVRALSSVLVVAQVGVALILLTGSGLLIQSFARAMAVDVGFNPRGVVTARVALPLVHRSTPEAAMRLRDRLREEMRRIPGTTSAAVAFATPFLGGLPINAFTLEQDTLPPGAPQPGAFRVIVTPDYLDTLGLTLVEGRFYEEADLTPTRPIFVVDETFARKYFPNRSAVGGRFTFGPPPDDPTQWPVIVGVVKDVPHNGVEEKSGNPFVYQIMAAGQANVLTLFVRNSRATADVVEDLRRAVQGIDPAIPLFDAGPLAAAVDSSFDSRRALMWLLTAFAGVALFLSALGIYGVLAYDVSQRRREIGVRGAIGATHGTIVNLILTQGLVKAGIGAALGLVGAILLSRYMTTLLFEVEPTQPIVYVAVSLLLVAVAAVASYLPARRAARIDPLSALRDA
jgi:putative ABC transport system permease protein